VYPAIIEPFMGESKIRSAREIPIPNSGDGVGKPVALQVQTTFGQTDYLFSATRDSESVKVTNDFTAAGELSIASFDNNGLRLLHLVGGKEIIAKDVHIRLEKSQHVATLKSASYNSRYARLETPLPSQLLVGSVFTVGNDAHKSTRKISGWKPSSNDVLFDRTSLMYRGGVEHVNDKEGYIELDLAPFLQAYHPDFYSGMTVVNERGQVLGKARIELGDRFFYTGFPEARRHLAHIAQDDITDANGDGKLTVSMHVSEQSGTSGAQKFAEDGETVIKLQPGEKMMDMEVSRVREDGFMIYTKQFPRIYLDALKLPHPGWPYHQQVIRNEAGTKEWVVNMPGDVYRLFVDGKKLNQSDVPDANKDGRAMVYLHDYGPGDEISTPTHAYLARKSKGLYELRANAGLTITLPGNKAQISTDDSKTFADLADVKKSKGEITFTLNADQLDDGTVMLKVE